MRVPILILLLALALPAAARAAERPTEPFRAEHVELREHLRHIDEAVESLGTLAPEQRAKRMAWITAFLDEHVLAHAGWEERVLYPLVDARTTSGKHPFTETMRYEHGVVGRWLGELKTLRDAAPFARVAHRLLGLLAAHFEEEEEVLLPVLDGSMTREEFERAVRGGH